LLLLLFLSKLLLLIYPFIKLYVIWLHKTYHSIDHVFKWHKSEHDTKIRNTKLLVKMLIEITNFFESFIRHDDISKDCVPYSVKYRKLLIAIFLKT